MRGPGIREFAGGGALGAAGHDAALCEVDVGLGDAEGGFVVAAAFVEACERLVGVAADETFRDALFVEAYRGFRVTVPVGLHGLFVAFDGGFVAAQGVFFGPDPLFLFRAQG